MYLFSFSLHQHGTRPCINIAGSVCVCGCVCVRVVCSPFYVVLFNLERVLLNGWLFKHLFKLLQSDLKQLQVCYLKKSWILFRLTDFCLHFNLILHFLLEIKLYSLAFLFFLDHMSLIWVWVHFLPIFLLFFSLYVPFFRCQLFECELLPYS